MAGVRRSRRWAMEVAGLGDDGAYDRDDISRRPPACCATRILDNGRRRARPPRIRRIDRGPMKCLMAEPLRPPRSRAIRLLSKPQVRESERAARWPPRSQPSVRAKRASDQKCSNDHLPITSNHPHSEGAGAPSEVRPRMKKKGEAVCEPVRVAGPRVPRVTIGYSCCLHRERRDDRPTISRDHAPARDQPAIGALGGVVMELRRLRPGFP